ncbi:MAG: peptide chain release factor N(5)-glutamine methyltransferase [Betaproteobacteria bacterium]|nr:peptide chain release factor N(5)-glutamine methyltransferase [Betaproteobacteria bacterium]
MRCSRRSPANSRPSNSPSSPKKRRDTHLTIGQALGASGLEAREARLLLAHASGFSGAALVAFPERSLSEEAAARFAAFAERRRRGEPVAYIVGEKEFYGLAITVTPAVLIPRPETELLVELALERPFASVVDLGTGSGAIALVLKKHRPGARVVAVEASAAALEVARRNAVRLALEVEWRHGRWCEPLAGESYELIVANPPYVAEGDPHLAALGYEPRQALVSGGDGLEALGTIVAQARAYLARGGWLLLEHGQGQDAAVRRLLTEARLEEARTWPDLAGIPRVTGARR